MPKSAVMIGRPIASTDPNAINRMKHRGEDADRLARGLRLVGEHRAAELDLQIGVFAAFTWLRMCVARSTGTSLACTSNWISA